MAVGNAGLDCGTAQYEPFRSEASIILTAGDGQKTVSVCLKDAAGNVALVSDSIILDTTPPAGGLPLNDGTVLRTNVVSITVNRDGNDANAFALTIGYLDCNSPALCTAIPNEVQVLNLPGEGEFEVSLCLKDNAGNTTKYVENVLIDSTAPTGLLPSTVRPNTRRLKWSLSTSPPQPM